MEELQQLRVKVDALVKQHKALLATNRKLTTALADRDAKIESLQAALASSEELSLAHAAGTLLRNPAERKKVRKQIDAVISSIDKILISLDD